MAANQPESELHRARMSDTPSLVPIWPCMTRNKLSSNCSYGWGCVREMIKSIVDCFDLYLLINATTSYLAGALAAS